MSAFTLAGGKIFNYILVVDIIENTTRFSRSILIEGNRRVRLDVRERRVVFKEKQRVLEFFTALYKTSAKYS